MGTSSLNIISTDQLGKRVVAGQIFIRRRDRFFLHLGFFLHAKEAFERRSINLAYSSTSHPYSGGGGGEGGSSIDHGHNGRPVEKFRTPV
jgi:hypothetical protein